MESAVSSPESHWLRGRLPAAAVSALPVAPLTFLLSALVRSTASRRPELLERLGPHGRKRFGISVADAPLAFLLEPQARRCIAARRLPVAVDVHIGGPLADLIELVDGDLDGDALFFSRRLTLAGDVEAALALRNALDDARLDLAAEAAAIAPVFPKVVERGLRIGFDLIRRGRQWT